jgi:hypothetical protein
MTTASLVDNRQELNLSFSYESTKMTGFFFFISFLSLVQILYSSYHPEYA